MRSCSFDRRKRPTGRHRLGVADARRGSNTTVAALVVLGVSTVAFGVGAGLVAAIQDDLVQEAEKAAVTAPAEDDAESGSWASLMERLEAEPARVQDRSGRAAAATPQPDERGDPGRHDADLTR